MSERLYLTPHGEHVAGALKPASRSRVDLALSILRDVYRIDGSLDDIDLAKPDNDSADEGCYSECVKHLGALRNAALELMSTYVGHEVQIDVNDVPARAPRDEDAQDDAGLSFRIGPNVYEVRIASEGLMFEGRKVDALCDESTGVITMCSAIPSKRRLHVLIHELRHAWAYCFGRSADDDEDDAQNVASFTIDVMRQLDKQGGESALLNMEAA
ncbi:MAG: hypothetical protein AAF561_00370 [Planctomycetota bacterium]